MKSKEARKYIFSCLDDIAHVRSAVQTTMYLTGLQRKFNIKCSEDAGDSVFTRGSTHTATYEQNRVYTSYYWERKKVPLSLTSLQLNVKPKFNKKESSGFTHYSLLK